MYWAYAIGGFPVCDRHGDRRVVLGRVEEFVLCRSARAVRWPSGPRRVPRRGLDVDDCPRIGRCIDAFSSRASAMWPACRLINE
jgi:hypothetical protein